MSKRGNFPTTADLHAQIQSSFENAGNDISPISVESQSQASNEVEKLVNDLNSQKDWDFMVDAMERAMGLINGGLLNYCNDQTIKNSFSKICQPLLNSAKNLRSALVKQSCLLITQIAHKLGPINKFDLFVPPGEEVIFSLSSQTSHGTQIIAESCRCAMTEIAKSCTVKKVLNSILDLSKVKSSMNRQISADCLYFICGGEISANIANPWSENKLVEKNIDAISDALHRLMEDASQSTRKSSREASQIFIANYPQYQDQFMSETDERSINYFEKKKTQASRSKIAVRRAHSPHTSLLPVPKKKKKAQQPNQESSSQKESSEGQERPKTTEPKGNRSSLEGSKPIQQKSTFGYKPKGASMISKSQNSSSSHRSRSTQPLTRRKPTEEKPTLKLEPGHESEFLDSIEEYVNTNQQFELAQQLSTITAGLFDCSVNEDRTIHERSVKLIYSLVHSFPKTFTNYLPQIIDIILSSTQRANNSDNDEDGFYMARELQSIYNPNQLLKSTENIQISRPLLKFVANICNDMETDLLSKEICDNLFEIVTTMLNEDKDSCRNIIIAIYRQNPSYFITKSRELLKGANNNDEFGGLDPHIQEMIREYQNHPEYPHFNPRGVSVWCNEIRQFIKLDEFVQKLNSTKEEDVTEVKTLFVEISKAINLTNEKNLIVALIIDVLNQTGNVYYDIFIIDIITFYRNRKATNISALLKYLISTIDNENLIKTFESYTEAVQNDAKLCRNYNDIWTDIIKNGNKERVENAFDEIVNCLLLFIEHKDSDVRRAVIMAFVQLSFVLPEKTSEAVQKLTKVQQRLIRFYRDQRD